LGWWSFIDWLEDGWLNHPLRTQSFRLTLDLDLLIQGTRKGSQTWLAGKYPVSGCCSHSNGRCRDVPATLENGSTSDNG
jgi:hypothetical protein